MKTPYGFMMSLEILFPIYGFCFWYHAWIVFLVSWERVSPPSDSVEYSQLNKKYTYYETIDFIKETHEIKWNLKNKWQDSKHKLRNE